MKAMFLAAALLALSACATIRPPLPPSLELPKPPADLHAVRKGDKAVLTWAVPTVTTDRQTIHSFGATDICRGEKPPLTQCGKPVDQVAPIATAGKSSQKISATFIDTLPAALGRDPLASTTYAVEVLNTDGRGAGLSNQVQVSLAPTLPPPRDFVSWLSDEGVTLTWQADPVPAEPHVNYVYRVTRRMEGSQTWALVGEIAMDNKSKYSVIDNNIEWEKTYYYRAEAVTLVSREGQPDERIDGDDTSEIRVFADDIFPPAVPSGLQAVFSGPGQQPFIDLIWAPVPNIDLAGYNIYRHESGAEPVKINTDLVKTPAYRDANVTAGRTYFYSISAVDARGNESSHSEEASENVP